MYIHKLRKPETMVQKSYVRTCIKFFFFYLWERYLVFVIRPVNFGQRTREQT